MAVGGERMRSSSGSSDSSNGNEEQRKETGGEDSDNLMAAAIFIVDLLCLCYTLSCVLFVFFLPHTIILLFLSYVIL